MIGALLALSSHLSLPLDVVTQKLAWLGVVALPVLFLDGR